MIRKELFIIYQIINTINKKDYWGAHKTKNINDSYYGSGIHIKRAINKYGIECFDKLITGVFVSQDIMYWIERMIVDNNMVLDKNNYNLTIGGHGGWGHINTGQPTHNKNKNAYTDGVTNIYLGDSEDIPDGFAPGSCRNEQITCPYCGKKSKPSYIKKWHNENCHLNPNKNKHDNSGMCPLCCQTFYDLRLHSGKCALNPDYHKNILGESCPIFTKCKYCDIVRKTNQISKHQSRCPKRK